MRRMFSSRSSALNPRFLFRPWRTLSPSSSAVRRPRSASACSSVQATVDLPDPERPVNQRTHPCAGKVVGSCCGWGAQGRAGATRQEWETRQVCHAGHGVCYYCYCVIVVYCHHLLTKQILLGLQGYPALMPLDVGAAGYLNNFDCTEYTRHHCARNSHAHTCDAHNKSIKHTCAQTGMLCAAPAACCSVPLPPPPHHPAPTGAQHLMAQR